MRFAGTLTYVLTVAVTLGSAAPVQACGLLDWLFHREPEPVVAGYPCQPCNPCNQCDPCGGTCQPGVGVPAYGQPVYAPPATVGYRGPIFRSIFAPVPVTAYRPVAGVDPSGMTNTVLRPCQTNTYMTQRVPTYAYRPLLRPSVYGYGAAQTSYYAPVYGQTSLYAPGIGQASYAEPVQGRDHAYEGLGATNFAPVAGYAPGYPAPGYMAPPALSGQGCPTCSGRLPLTAGYPAVMSPTTTVVAPTAGYPTYPTSSYPTSSYPANSYGANGSANGYPAGTIVTIPAPSQPASPAVVTPGSANVAPALNPAEVQRVAPLNSGSGLVPVTPGSPTASGVHYPKPAVPTPHLNLRPLPDLDPPAAPQVKPAPPLLNPNDRTAARPVATAWEGRSTVQPAVHTVEAAPQPKQWDDSGWRAARD